MAIVSGIPLTDDLDFEKILAIQGATALNRSVGNWDNVHLEAVEAIIRKLSGTLDPAKITNQTIFREYSITWVAHKIFTQHALDGGDEISFAKASDLEAAMPKLWKETYDAIIIDSDGDGSGDTRIGRSIPQVMNINSGGHFAGGPGRGVQHNKKLEGFDQGVKDGT